MGNSSSSEPDSRRIDLIEFKDFEKIGSGSFGVVFRARWRNKMVAVKQVKDAQKDAKRYEREIGQALNLEHKNIVKVYGFAPDREDSVYLVMELAEGSLFNALHDPGEKKPEISVAKSWGLQCAEGVAYLHSQDIMHRDLKSLNALLFQKRTVLKLCDFGEARDISSVSGTAYMMYYVGTIPYMAPEVLEGKRYTEKCDVYSWAIVMWEILTSKIPFNDYDGAEEIKEAKRSGRTPFRVKGKPGIPDDLDNLIVRCWQHGPSDRPTMSQIVSEMKALQDDMTGYSRVL